MTPDAWSKRKNIDGPPVCLLLSWIMHCASTFFEIFWYPPCPLPSTSWLLELEIVTWSDLCQAELTMNELRLSHQKSLILVADQWLSNVIVLFIVVQCLPGFAGCLKQYLAKHLGNICKCIWVHSWKIAVAVTLNQLETPKTSNPVA